MKPSFVGRFLNFASIPHLRSLKVFPFFAHLLIFPGCFWASPIPKAWNLRMVVHTNLRFSACIISERMPLPNLKGCSMLVMFNVHFSYQIANGCRSHFQTNRHPLLYPFVSPLTLGKPHLWWSTDTIHLRPLPRSSPLHWSAHAHESSSPKPAGVPARIVAMALPAHVEWHRVLIVILF